MDEKPMTSQQFKKYRESLSLTQEQLGGVLGKSERYITYHESGKRPIGTVLKYAIFWLLLPKRIRNKHAPKL